MKCPKCGKFMEQGYLNTGGSRLLWTAEPNRMDTLPRPDDVVLQRHLRWKSRNEAHICKECRCIWVEYDEQ